MLCCNALNVILFYYVILMCLFLVKEITPQPTQKLRVSFRVHSGSFWEPGSSDLDSLLWDRSSSSVPFYDKFCVDEKIVS